MSPVTISDAARAAIYASSTDECFIMLLEISEGSLAEPIRLSGDAVNTVSGDELYLAFPFEMSIPPQQPDQMPEITLRADNVDQVISEAIRNARGNPTVTLKVVLASNPDVIEAGPFNFTLRAASVTATTVEGQLVYEDLLNQAYPGYLFIPSLFPGLF